MIFRTGGRYRSGTVNVRSAVLARDQFGNAFVQTPALRVKVREHTIDTDAEAEKFGWSDEDKSLVEDKLIRLAETKHNRARGRGIYLDEKPITDPAQVVRQCRHFWVEDGKPVVCTELVGADQLYCTKHQPTETDAPLEVAAKAGDA